MADERILIAEDEADVLDMCVRALSREGYRVVGAHSGVEALALVKQQTFDLLLTDIKMPGLSGLQAYREIKQLIPDIIGVAITGYGSVETAIEALKLGMEDFVLKPFSLDDLKAAVAKALDRARLERENTRLKALIPLFEISKSLVSVTDLDALLRQVLEVAVRETKSDLAVLMLNDTPSGELGVRAAIDADGDNLPPSAFALAPELARSALHGNGVQVVRNPLQGGFFVPGAEKKGPVTAGLAQPLIVRKEVSGVLAVAKVRDESYYEGDIEFLSVLASQAATAIQNARLFTQLRRTYEKLASLDDLKSEFISVVAHELRTPLAEISTYLALSEQETAIGGPFLAGIERAATRLTELMDDITDLKFLEAGQIELHATRLSLVRLLADAVQQLVPLATVQGQTISMSVQEGLDEVLADGPKLQVVLKNLISNAIKFSPTGGVVHVAAWPTGKTLRIAVHDEGAGIPQEEWEWIFKPFYQRESSLRREHGGLGIGLALSRSLVELHGGHLWVESQVGKGSTFTFTVPECVC
jgi:signal transduction histidine kinase/CheY-like chemotaxis protein